MPKVVPPACPPAVHPGKRILSPSELTGMPAACMPWRLNPQWVTGTRAATARGRQEEPTVPAATRFEEADGRGPSLLGVDKLPGRFQHFGRQRGTKVEMTSGVQQLPRGPKAWKCVSYNAFPTRFAPWELYCERVHSIH